MREERQEAAREEGRGHRGGNTRGGRKRTRTQFYDPDREGLNDRSRLAGWLVLPILIETIVGQPVGEQGDRAGGPGRGEGRKRTREGADGAPQEQAKRQRTDDGARPTGARDTGRNTAGWDYG